MRTVEDILSSIPGYEAESEVKPEAASTPIAKPAVEVAQATTAAAGQTVAQTQATPKSLDGNSSKPAPKAATGQASTESCPSPLNCNGEALVPVSWFAQTEEAAADDLGIGSAGTVSPSDSVGVNFVSTSVDPVSGEEVFDVRDFSELADAKPQSIPNAFSDGSATGDVQTPADAKPASSTAADSSTGKGKAGEEKIHSPLSQASKGLGASADQSGLGAEKAPSSSAGEGEANRQSAATDKANTKTPTRVTTVMPVSSPLTSSAAATAGAGLAAAGAGGGLLASALATSTSGSTDTDSSAGDTPSQSISNTPGSDAKQESQTRAKSLSGSPLSKKAPPAPAIEDDEIAAALKSCEDSPEPTPQSGVANSGTESFNETFGSPGAAGVAGAGVGAAGAGVGAAGAGDGLESPVEQTATQSDDTFFADGGDVIRIDGNDGFDFIDLTCFERNSAEVKPDRIVVQDQENPAFEVHYKNVDYALFAYGVKVDLPPQTPPKAG